jgi:phthalate 4,5-dioxygenase
MGPFVDHDNATFVASDLLVARMRRRMLAAAEALAQGKPPPGIEEPACYRDVWSGYFIAPRETDWLEVYAKNIPRASDRAA